MPVVGTIGGMIVGAIVGIIVEAPIYDGKNLATYISDLVYVDPSFVYYAYEPTREK